VPSGYAEAILNRRLPRFGALGQRSRQLAPVCSSVRIPVSTLMALFHGGDMDKALAELETPARLMNDDLLCWTTAHKTARKALRRARSSSP
jgi:hypothetical protein